ncbi:MAG: hypothetical protein JO256_05965, partial [Alphaproteobacteria bacterium]|nr:hypothetical protein [Alphaproteobacteria bacterium]
MKWRAIWDKIGQRQVKEVAPAERDCTLCVFTSDVRCILTVQDRTGAELSRLTELSNAPAADPATLVSNAMLKLAAELESRIGNVLIYLDDPELSVVDSRQAKLTHFEGRALAEFGKYQLGGRPTAFASSAYGQTGQTESEKRVVGYLSEDKLSAVLFALGRLAKFATFFGPWSAQHDLARAEEEPVASLTVHGRFSTLTMANEAAGAVAVRHIPIGTASLVEAYGAEYGLSFEEAAKLLKARPRMTLNGKQAHAGTASQAALLPGIDRFASEFAATADYFEYQRLSGRAPRLSLSVIGHEIAGFAEWLHKLLDMEVENAGAAILPDKAGLLNFLEGMRSGLLKLGNQLYDFTGGRFVVSKLNP